MFDLKRTICALLVLATLASAIAAQGATYYVATTGSNSNTCAQAQSPSTPKQTIGAGISCLAGSDTLIVSAGTYAEQTIQSVPAGSTGAYTIIKGDPAGSRPIISSTGGSRGVYLIDGGAHHIEIRHFEFSGVYEGMKLNSNLVTFPNHIRFIDNVVHDTVNVGILTAAASDESGGDHYFGQNTFYNIGVGTPGYIPGMLTIYNMGNRSIVEGNIIHNDCNGISAWTGGPRVYDVIIRGNKLYDMGRKGIDTWQVGSSCNSSIRITSGTRAQVYNNVVYRSNNPGIYVDSAPEVDQVQIYNNTVYNTLDNSNGITVVSGATNITVKNNIAYLTGGITGGTQSNNLTTNPLFVDAANGNFHLQLGSPAIDAGSILSGITVDIDGILRPQGLAYDIGAYEYQALAPPLNLRVQ